VSYELVDATFAIGLPPTEKAVLLALCRHAHADGTGSYASVHTLAMEAGLGERTVKRALAALEARNYIVAEGLPKDWRKLSQEEGSKAGGRHGQTVTYKILIPNADVVAAVKATWKTGAPQAPDGEGPEGNGCPTGTPTGATQAPTGAPQAPTGATAAPKSVKEAVREPASFEKVNGGGGGGGTAVTVADSRALKVVQAFYDITGHTMPANEKQLKKLEAVFTKVPGDIACWALMEWTKGRVAGFEDLKHPVEFLIREIPPIINSVCEQLDLGGKWEKERRAQMAYSHRGSKAIY
jgi:hypothetical protein